MKTVALLSDVCEIIAGQSPPSNTYNSEGIGMPFFQGKTDFSDTYPIVRMYCSKPVKLAKPGDILLSVRAPVGPTNLSNIDCCIGRGLSAIRPTGEIDIKYLLYYFKFFEKELTAQGRGSTFGAITQADIRKLKIPIANLPTQQKIAEILSEVDKARQLRKQANLLTDQFLQSTFLNMFGDPSQNKMNWQKLTLKEVSTRFSDGPFGSNLKTEHYSEKGIPVIRLQNIGVNEFIENNKSFVNETHYENVLKKYTCFPADIVIATMGEPNVRACIVPNHIKISVNKADCVLCRVNRKIANEYYLSYLLNQKGFLHLAEAFIHGQTRARISSGQLARIEIPIPPIKLQQQFADIVAETEQLRQRQRAHEVELDQLFKGLLQKYFG